MPSLPTLQAVFDLLPDAVFCVDRPTLSIVAGNPLACAAIGIPLEELRGVKLDDLCPRQDIAALTRRMDAAGGAVLRTVLRGRNGRETAVEWRVSPANDDTREYWIVVSREWVGPMPSESIGLGLPGHDPLTGLPDRRLFERRLDRAIENARHCESYRFAVCFIDLDGFKTVNDRFGHLIGDRALCETARRLIACVRPTDMAARFGGDEFTVFLDALGDASNAVTAAGRILEQLESPARFDGNEIRLPASIGVTAWSADCRGIEDLLRRADRAMYRAKSLGGGRVSR